MWIKCFHSAHSRTHVIGWILSIKITNICYQNFICFRICSNRWIRQTVIQTFGLIFVFIVEHQVAKISYMSRVKWKYSSFNGISKWVVPGKKEGNSDYYTVHLKTRLRTNKRYYQLVGIWIISCYGLDWSLVVKYFG